MNIFPLYSFHLICSNSSLYFFTKFTQSKRPKIKPFLCFWSYSRTCYFNFNKWSMVNMLFRQHAASGYGFVRFVSFVSFVAKKIEATSKQGRRLRFGMLTVLTNIRSTKVLHHASCIMHHAS